MPTQIDVAFNFRRDTPPDKDPDIYNKTLRRFHKMLWSKHLPGGEFFGLSDSTPGCYLHHRSDLGEFRLASDTVTATYTKVRHLQNLVTQPEFDEFTDIAYTIGGMMIFPGNQVDGKWTINQARGCTRQIGDRFDLTLECIRRYYTNDDSPLSSVLKRYSSFFALFRDFQGYVKFFLLQDLVTVDLAAVRISTPFDGFNQSPIPSNVDEFRTYKSAAIAFIEARNERIQREC